MKPPDSKNEYKLEIVRKIETLVQSFTTFAATVLFHSSTSSELLTLATPLFDKLHIPKIWVLNASATDLQDEMLIDTGRNVS